MGFVGCGMKRVGYSTGDAKLLNLLPDMSTRYWGIQFIVNNKGILMKPDLTIRVIL